jgi:alkylhydroperoxidase/carboxymuconolactone decarboxylase family protein YurZ
MKKIEFIALLRNEINNNNTIENLCILAGCIASKKHQYLEIIFNEFKLCKVKTTKIYECILQSYLFCGFPSTLVTLKKFKKYYPDFKSINYSYNLRKYTLKGWLNCKLIYGNKFEKLIKNIDYLSSEIQNWMIIEGYGKIMGRKFLSLKERELINVTMLSVNFYKHQLISHIIGATNTQSDIAEINKAIDKGGFFNTKQNIKLSKQIISLIN